MSQVFSEGNEVLQKLWKDHNPNDQEYLQKESVIEWIKLALKQTNTLQNFQSSMTDLDGLIKQYLSQVHEVTQENKQNISMSYSESVDFLKWLTNTTQEQKELDQAVKQLENSHHFQLHQQVQQPQQEGQQNNHQVQKAKQPFQQQIIQEYQHLAQKIQASIRSPKRDKLQQSIHSKRRQKTEQLEHNFKKIKTQVLEKENNEQNNDDDLNQNQTSNPNQFNLEHISKKYKDYLRVIFDHYCKASYATGQDPTFQQIMHKTTIMTINKFMMFCKDFQISKTHASVNRNFLIEIFKKNSQCYKQMSFDQFVTVFRKLSIVGLEEKPQSTTQDKNLLTNQMVKLLQFCELSTAKKFKQKLKRLNIQYRAGAKTNAELKVVPQGYKFKFTSNNGKSQEQIIQQIHQRKINRSQRKLFLREKVNLNQNDFSLNKKSAEVKKKQLNISKQKPSFTRQTQNQTQSNQIINKVLTPLTHVTKKNPLPPPLPPKSNNTPVQNHTGSTSNNNANLFKKQLGYAQLHKIKQTETYSRKRAITNSNTRSHDAKGSFKLNSIVQQARMEVLDMNNQIHSQQLTESLATNSREQTNRLKSYDMNKINHKMQQINDKIKRDRQIQQELTGLLDIDNDEQDEYLIEHLEREKKNQSIVKRLSNKINQL